MSVYEIRRSPADHPQWFDKGLWAINMYSELIMRHALETWEDGIEIGGKLYNNLRYADDVALLATTEDNLHQLVNDVGKASERFVLSLNAKKTQVMVIGRHTSTINIMEPPWNNTLNSSFTLAQASTRKEILSRRLQGE